MPESVFQSDPVTEKAVRIAPSLLHWLVAIFRKFLRTGIWVSMGILSREYRTNMNTSEMRCATYIIDLIFSPCFWLTIPDFTLTLVLSVISCLQNMATLAFSFSMVFAVGPVQNPSIVEYSPDLYACTVQIYMHVLYEILYDFICIYYCMIL